MSSKNYLDDVMNHVGRLFSRKDPSGPQTAGGQGPNPEKFRRRLKAIMAAEGRVDASNIHYIGLTKVRAHYGARWPDLARSVNIVTRRAIERHLGEEDAYTLYRDDGYLIAFSGLLKEQAQTCCGLIAEELSKQLFGRKTSDQIDIATIDVGKEGIVSGQPMTVGPTTEPSTRRSGSSPPRTDKVPAAKAKREPMTDDVGKAVPSATPNLSDTRDETPREAVAANQGPEPLTEAAKAAASVTEIEPPGQGRPTPRGNRGKTAKKADASGGVADPLVELAKTTASVTEIEIPGQTRTTARTRTRAPSARGARTPAARAGHQQVPNQTSDGSGAAEADQEEWAQSAEAEGLQFVYRPMWLARRKVISAYLCLPSRITSDGTILFGGAAMPLNYSSPENALLDVFTLRKVLGDLRQLIADKRKLIMVAPVHYVTLNIPKNRRSFLEHCINLSENYKKLLVFELIGLPKDLPYAPLVGAFSAIRPFSRAVLVRRRLDSADFEKLRQMGVWGTGVDVGNIPLSESEIIEGMDTFNESASKFGLATYIHGLPSISLTSAAAGAGFTFIDGDPVMSVVDVPESVSPFDVESIYRSMLA